MRHAKCVFYSRPQMFTLSNRSIVVIGNRTCCMQMKRYGHSTHTMPTIAIGPHVECCELQTNLSFICVCFLFCFLAKLEFCSSGSVTARRARGYVSNNNSHFAAVCSDGVRVRASAHKQQLNYVPNFQVQVHGCSQDRDQRLLPAIGYRLNEPRISNLFPFEH